MEKTFKSIREELDYWYDKGGKEGLYNHYMIWSQLRDLVRAIRSNQDISEWDKFRKNYNISDEELEELVNSNEF